MWPLFQRWRKQKNVLFFISGILAFFNGYVLLLIPVLFLVSVVILNTVEIAYLITIVGMMIASVFLDVEDMYLFLNIGFFFILFILFYSVVVKTIEGKKKTLTQRFSER